MRESRNVPGDLPPGAQQRWADGWRRLMLSAGMLMYPAITAIELSQYSTGAAAIAGYAIIGVFTACYVATVIASVRPSRPRFWVLIGAMTVLFLAALPFAQAAAFFLCAVVVSMAAAQMKRYVAPVVTFAVLASLLVPWAVRPWHSGPGWLQAITIVFTVLLVLGFADTMYANRALVEARAEVARLASEAERSRIARDLHDLVGHTLTAITVKSDLARRLAEAGSPRSIPEITEVAELSRQALADMRAAVSGYRYVTVASELARGRELLRAAGVTADLPTATDMVDVDHQELFGWVVREGLTNVVRHARATRCTVTLSTSEVEIRDDGSGTPGSAGNGLTGLRERVAAVGGRLDAGPVTPRGWRLRASFEPTGTRPT
jgi:two-component system sensor histidine kinase DesK